MLPGMFGLSKAENSQRGHRVSPTGSVGDGRSPLATIAPLCIPHGGERTPRGVCLYLAASFAKAKLGRASRATRDLARAHTPVRARLALDYYKKGVSKGAIAPFEMRCIEFPPPPVAASPLPELTISTGGGRGVGTSRKETPSRTNQSC